MESYSETHDLLRQPLNQQPIQCLLIDLSFPSTAQNLDTVADCLHQVLPIISVMPGPPRVPLLAILVANNSRGLSEEVILGFEKIRGNFARCFEAVRSMHTEFVCTKQSKSSSSLSEALAKALNMYQNLIKKPGMQYDLEVTIVSSLLGFKVEQQVARALTLVGTCRVKMVTVFTVQSQHNVNIDEIDISDEADAELSSLNSMDSINIQYMLLTNSSEEDKKILTRHFMGWLTDKNKDTYALHFSLPHPYNDSEEIDLKFDLKEFLIPTSAIPFHNKTSVELTAAFMKPPHLLSKSDSVLKYLAPVFTLTVLHRISYTKELVPYLYGTPMVLEATQCWKIDWDELEVNKSHVSALHSTLQQQNLALICQLQQCSADDDAIPLPYYCIFPTTHCLLIHHVSYNELLLYQTLSRVKQEVDVNYQVKIDMEMVLKKVKVKDNLDDLVEAGLIKCLTKTLLPKRLSNKRRPLTSSNTATKRVKSRYPPLAVSSTSQQQPMEVCSTLSQDGNGASKHYLPSQHYTQGSTSKLSAASQAKSAAVLSKLQSPRVRQSRKAHVPPSILSQLHSPSSPGQAASQSSNWITRDDSKPVPVSSTNFTGQTTPNRKVALCQPASYSRQGSASLGVSGEDNFLSAMDYDNSSQNSSQIRDVACKHSPFYQEYGTPKNSNTSGKRGVKFNAKEVDAVFSSDEDVQFIETDDGVLSPTWESMSFQEI